MKKALILGVTGQDGSYLAEILLEKGYEVHGLVRRTATGNTKNIEHILDKIALHRGDILDDTSLYRIIRETKPDEIYNEADQDHAGWSFDLVDYQYKITGVAPAVIMEIVRQLDPKIKIFQPISSNIFGKAAEQPQTEETPMRPQSPYACAKTLAYIASRFYREAYGMFVATGIFYNHESPRRTEEYVTRKITRGAAKISLGLADQIELGDLSAKIDWGYAREYMEAAWNVMQQPKADDYIICTGEAHSVQEFADAAFEALGLDAEKYIRVNPKFLRPASNTVLIGDFSKARKAFGFKPNVKFKELVGMMVKSDLEDLKKNAHAQ